MLNNRLKHFITDPTFDPSVAGVGAHIVTYTYTDPLTNCTNTNTITINVIAVPTVGLGAFAPVCENDAVFTLTGGTPAGGTYSGTGVTHPNFDPSGAGVGTHTITYTFSNGTCSNTATSDLVVNGLPTVGFVAPGPFCVNDGSFVFSVRG